MSYAQKAAVRALQGIAIDASFARAALPAAAPEFASIANYAPRPAQQKLLNLAVNVSLAAVNEAS